MHVCVCMPTCTSKHIFDVVVVCGRVHACCFLLLLLEFSWKEGWLGEFIEKNNCKVRVGTDVCASVSMPLWTLCNFRQVKSRRPPGKTKQSLRESVPLSLSVCVCVFCFFLLTLGWSSRGEDWEVCLSHCDVSRGQRKLVVLLWWRQRTRTEEKKGRRRGGEALAWDSLVGTWV